MDELEPDERKQFVDSVFDAIGKTEVERFQDLGTDTFRKMKRLIEGVTEMPSDDKKHVFQTIKNLLKITAEEIAEEIVEEFTDGE